MTLTYSPKNADKPGLIFFLLTDNANAIDKAQVFQHPLALGKPHAKSRQYRRSFYGPPCYEAYTIPKDEVIAILGTPEIAKQCDAVVRGTSAFGDFIASQVAS